MPDSSGTSGTQAARRAGRSPSWSNQQAGPAPPVREEGSVQRSHETVTLAAVRPAPVVPAWAAALLAVLLSMAGVLGLARPAAAAGPNTADILAAVNAARAQAGLAPYTLSSQLSSVALGWSQQMAAKNALSHNPSLTSQVSNWSYLGENVGVGPTWSAIETAFMNSPEHRSNILDHDFTQIGIGVVVSGDRVWITQDFRRPQTSASTSSSSASTASTTSRVASSGTRSAPAPATTRPAPKAPTSRAASAPSPRATLAARIDEATSRVPASNSKADPLSQAVTFLQTMSTIAG